MDAKYSSAGRFVSPEVGKSETIGYGLFELKTHSSQRVPGGRWDVEREAIALVSRMKSFVIEIADTLPCWECDFFVPVGTHPCPNCGEMSVCLAFTDFFLMLERGEIANACMGGLVVGRDDDKDDIPMFRYMDNGLFKFVGLMQGGEFLMSTRASTKNLARLEEINAEQGAWSPMGQMALTSASAIINTNLISPTVCLWIQPGQFIVNRFATTRYLSELERMNMESDSHSPGCP